MGFFGEAAQKINGGNFSQGADFDLASAVTPVINNMIGTLADQQFKIKPGSTKNLTSIAEVQFLNGESYLNRPVLVYNGTNFSTVMQCTQDILTYSNDSNVLITNASYGMQFEP